MAPACEEMIELPMRHPELFQKLGIEPPKGVLLYADTPGTGKTLIAKAVSWQRRCPFHLDCRSRGHFQILREVSRSTEIFEKAESNAPSIIFIDEADSITPGGERGDR